MPTSGAETAASLLDSSLRDFAGLTFFEPLEEDIRFHQVAGAIHRLCETLRALEQQGLSRAEILARAAPIRALHASSPLLRRCQVWPRGYPGDFETIEWLCDVRNAAAYGTVGYLIEQHILNCQASQQHRNKIRRQGDLVAQTFRAHQDTPGKTPRVLLIASGGCRDVLLVKDELLRMRGELVLVDIDEGAVALASERLRDFGPRLRVFKGNIFRLLRKLPGPFDLILAGGLFDYLQDKHVAHLLRACVGDLLAPGGAVFFTNIATGNPYRVWMEYMADWRLSERSEEGVRKFLVHSGFADGSFEFSRDPTGLTLFVSLRAQPLGPAREGPVPSDGLPCPHDVGFEMVAQQVRAVTVDLCPLCGGCWLDAGELEQLASAGGAPAPALQLRAPRAGERLCPRGHGPMQQGQHPQAAELELDQCARCGGLWFDRGELARVFEVIALDSAPESR